MNSPEQSASYADEMLNRSGRSPDLLLQYLLELQQAYSYIPPPAIERLAELPGSSLARVRSLIGFYSFLHDSPRGQFDILFSDNITDHMLGSRELMQDLCQRLGVEPGAPRADGRVSVDTTSCTGMCDQGPAMLVNGITVTRLDAARIASIAGLVESATPLAEWPADYFEVVDNIRIKGPLLESKLVAGAAIDALQQAGAEGALQSVLQSGLRGRGGAGFTTGQKWQFCRDAKSDGNNRVVICNADEGEPGTFKDRVLLDSYADDVIEGMTLCAGVIGADSGYIYLRGEYLYMREHLQQVLNDRRAQGLLGKAIRGVEGFDFDIEIHMGAGAYICGEESALIESLEGKRGDPRIRPPFPVENGYLGRPTVVNNVETFMAAAHIAIHGADWYGSIGTEQSTGTKLLSISGDCERPGIYEISLGTSIHDVLKACGGEQAIAVQVAGAAGNTLMASEFDRAIAFEDVATGGSFMVFNGDRDLLDMVQNFMHFFVHESCGFCTPCRVGGALVKDLVDKLHAGHGCQYDIDELVSIGKLMKTTSHCGLGTTAPNALLDTIEKAPEIYTSRITRHDYEPSFDLDASLQKARDITGRDDEGAHIQVEP